MGEAAVSHPTVGVGDKLRYLQLRPQEADVPGAFTPRTIHINRTKVDKESCASFFSPILMARSLFSLMCLPLAILKKCLICWDSAVWSFFTTPLPHKRAVFHTPPHYRHINYLSSSSIKNTPGPNVLLGRLGGFRCNVRVQTALNCNWAETAQDHLPLLQTWPHVCGWWPYGNRHRVKDKAESDMTSQCHFKSPGSPCMPDSNSDQSKRETCFWPFQLNLWLHVVHTTQMRLSTRPKVLRLRTQLNF